MRSISRWILATFVSPAGVAILAALDSTILFSLPFGIDAVVVILAARMGRLAWIVPLLATGGSLAGAWLTFWMGVRIGDKGLERFVPARRLHRIRTRTRRYGAIALATLDLIPPPFPFTAFVLAAGALEVSGQTFFVTLTVCRLFRFGIEAALAVRYGQAILGWVETDLFPEIVGGLIVLTIVLTLLSVFRLLRTHGRIAARPGHARA